jgi:hypothetical protein
MPLRSSRKLGPELPEQRGPALPGTRGGFFVHQIQTKCIAASAYAGYANVT